MSSIPSFVVVCLQWLFPVAVVARAGFGLQRRIRVRSLRSFVRSFPHTFEDIRAFVKMTSSANLRKILSGIIIQLSLIIVG